MRDRIQTQTIGLSIIVCVCVIPLGLGVDSILLMPLPGGLPFGTFLAVIALVAGAAIPLAQSHPGSWLRRVGTVTLLAAILWLPLGILLSGNPSLNFVNDASDSAVFWRFTKVLAGLILVTISWAALAAFLCRRS